jgi:hypothetical protein
VNYATRIRRGKKRSFVRHLQDAVIARDPQDFEETSLQPCSSLISRRRTSTQIMHERPFGL